MILNFDPLPLRRCIINKCTADRADDTVSSLIHEGIA